MFFFMVYFVVIWIILIVPIVIFSLFNIQVVGQILIFPFIQLAAVVAYERTFNGYGGNGTIPTVQPGVPIPPPYMPTSGAISASDTVETSESIPPAETKDETPPEA